MLLYTHKGQHPVAPNQEIADMNTSYALDMNAVNEAISKISSLLVQYHNHDYAQTEHSKDAVRLLLDKGISTKQHFQQLLEFREAHDKQIKKRYRVSLPSGIAAMMFDYEAVMKKRKVPQVTRVKIGLLDSLIAAVGMKVGAVKIHNVTA